MTSFTRATINYEYVPVIGDLMTARWSFEALAVEQFKNNRYEKNFFNYDMETSQNDWYASFLIPELEKKAQLCSYYKDNPEYKDQVAGYFRKLDVYTEKLSRLAGYSFPSKLKLSLSPKSFLIPILK